MTSSGQTLPIALKCSSPVFGDFLPGIPSPTDAPAARLGMSSPHSPDAVTYFAFGHGRVTLPTKVSLDVVGPVKGEARL